MVEPSLLVLAGGLGTRLESRTRTVPKLLVDVAGRPFVDWLLPHLVAGGIRDVVLCIGHMGEQIREHVADGARFGLRVRYSEDGPLLRGTAGAVAHALALVDEIFLVTYGDSYLPIDLLEPARVLSGQPNAAGVMTVIASDAETVEPPNAAIREDAAFSHHRVSRLVRYDKARRLGEPTLTHVDYGLLAFRRDAFVAAAQTLQARAARQVGGASLGLDAIQAHLAERGDLLAHVVTTPYFEMGSASGLDRLSRHLRDATEVGRR